MHHGIELFQKWKGLTSFSKLSKSGSLPGLSIEHLYQPFSNIQVSHEHQIHKEYLQIVIKIQHNLHFIYSANHTKISFHYFNICHSFLSHISNYQLPHSIIQTVLFTLRIWVFFITKTPRQSMQEND